MISLLILSYPAKKMNRNLQEGWICSFGPPGFPKNRPYPSSLPLASSSPRPSRCPPRARRQAPEPAAAPQLLTNADRVTYLCSFGWEVEPEPLETLQFLLPETLEEPYLTYNDLQKNQGFDLSACCGKQVTRYTYTVTNYPGRAQGVQANLYICEERPAAGDIFCAGADGFQEGLAFPKS